MKSFPFLINKDASGQVLQPIEAEKGGYSEAWLQEILRKQPNILPVAEIEPICHPMVPIGCEVSTETGTIDNLFISNRGYLTLVETKLWQNPESKREVVAQVIDYAGSLSKWNYDRLNDVVMEYTKKYEKVPLNLSDWVKKRLGSLEGGRDFFEDTVSKNLRLGRFLALIVGDRVRQSVIEMLSYVNKYPGLALNVALVEMQCYWMKERRSWPLVVVPRVVARTEIVERSVVQVTVIDGKGPKVDVGQERVRPEETERKRVSLTEEAFWELLRQRAPSYHGVVRNLIDEFKGKTGIEVSPRENSVVVQLDLHGTGQLASLFFVATNANLHVWPKTFARQLASAGFERTIAEDYEDRMSKLIPRPKNRRKFSCHISHVDIERFKSLVYESIRKIDLHQIGSK